MASGISAVTDVAELIPEITLEVDYIYQANSLGRQLVSVKDISGSLGVTVEFPIFTEVAGSASVGETAAPDSHQMNLSMATLTVAKRSVYTILGDLAVSATEGDLVTGVGKAMGMAQAKMVDARIFQILSGTTDFGTSPDATDGTLTITHVLAALLLLEKQEISETPRAVLHPHTFGKGPRTALTPIANDDSIAVSAGEEMSKNASLGRQFGVDWFTTPRCGSKTVDATADVYEGLLFVQSAIGYGLKVVVDGVEPDREASKAITGLIINWFDTAGVIRNSSQGVASLYSTSS